MHTNFQPETHGYQFINAWKLKPAEHAAARQSLSRATGEALEATGANDPFGLLRGMVGPQIEGWIEASLPDYYGLCGGMAFSAADHFRAGKPVPHGSDPRHTPDSDDPDEKPIRDYLWQRQLESLQPNAGVLLSWMVMLHLPLPGAGPAWLRDRTREQLKNLELFLAHGPWPICLIGSSLSPFDNHQVLAIGVEQGDSESGTLFLYDSNGPGRTQTIQIDLRSAPISAVESNPNPARGPLRGFFCMHYTPETPPDLGLGHRPHPDQRHPERT